MDYEPLPVEGRTVDLRSILSKPANRYWIETAAIELLSAPILTPDVDPLELT